MVVTYKNLRGFQYRTSHKICKKFSCPDICEEVRLLKEGRNLSRNDKRGLGIRVCKTFAYHEPYEFECPRYQEEEISLEVIKED